MLLFSLLCWTRFWESPKLWNLHCGWIPNEKIAVCLRQSWEVRHVSALVWLCSPPGSWDGSASAVTWDLPTQDIIRVPQDVSVLTLCTKENWNENTRSKCRRTTYSKKKKKSHLVWLSFLWEFPDQFSLCPKEIPA